MYNKIMKKKVIENKIQKENRLLSAAFELLTENEIQKLTDKAVEEIDKILENKEKEVMSI